MRKQSIRTSDGSPNDTMRQRIIETSKVLLAEEGPKALSMREVARRLELTHQAPYHYFPDRESILAEIVVQGFDELTERLARSGEANQSKDDLLLASSEAYVGFPRFTGAVDLAAHDGDVEVGVKFSDLVFEFLDDLGEVCLRPTARGAGDDVYSAFS